MEKFYKIGIAGMGSIGKRHLVNIGRVLEKRGVRYEIKLIRNGRGKETEDGLSSRISEIYYSYDTIPDDFDIIFITNPTSLHYESVCKFSQKSRHLFIEKPVFHRSDISIEGLGLTPGNVYYVACPLRHTGVIQYLKQQLIDIRVYCARIICSSYMPEWRPGLDYRELYSSSRELGGGVSTDLIHEWDYLYYLFGLPEQILNIRGKFSGLEIDSDDLSIYIARYMNMAAEVHLDYFGRKPIREIQLFTDGDTIQGDIVNNEIRHMKSGKIISFSEGRDDFQCKELNHFFDIVEGKLPNDNDIPTALTVLKMAEGNLK